MYIVTNTELSNWKAAYLLIISPKTGTKLIWDKPQILMLPSVKKVEVFKIGRSQRYELKLPQFQP